MTVDNDDDHEWLPWRESADEAARLRPDLRITRSWTRSAVDTHRLPRRSAGMGKTCYLRVRDIIDLKATAPKPRSQSPLAAAPFVPATDGPLASCGAA
jgi:hypothetical protein